MADLPILCVGDLHAPFHSRKALALTVALARKIKPKTIVQLGDLYDLYSYSRFARSFNVMTPAQEIQKGRRDSEYFWKSLQTAAGGNVQCHQLIGNHDERLVKKTMGLIPELEHFLESVKSYWTFDGVITQPSERDELILGNICFIHGYRRHGQHVTYNLMNTVCGHLHLGGVVYHKLKKKTIWELNAGYLADPASVPMKYSSQARISKSTQGVGLIDGYGPRFIPWE